MTEKIPNWDFQCPLSIHVLLTTNCNLNCPECFYKSNPSATISYERLFSLFEEWKEAKVRSLAFGGGEPMLYPDIVEVVDMARSLGFYVAVTTNGTILKPVCPNRLHISFDEIHRVPKTQVLKALKFYRREMEIERVGINHILTSQKSLKKALSLSEKVNTITLLMKKPLTEGYLDEWRGFIEKIYQDRDPKFWVDSCFAHAYGFRECRQGRFSMSLNSSLQASRCSNAGFKIPYTNLRETWEKIGKDRSCLFPPL